MKLKTNTILWIAIITALLCSCRDDVVVVYPTHDPTGDTSGGEYAGLYVLNEGNMGSNKCTLDYLDLATGVYSRNIYPSRNPNQVMELGDVGNDIKIYGSSLWMVVNMSNKVEVANASTAISRGHVDIPNCRSLAFDGRYAYVSSYVGEINAESVVGGVYKVDTTTLQVVGKVNVGYQPDELAVVDGKLYVANSGGYQAIHGKGYDRRVSVIDLATFTHQYDINVAPNLSLLRADRHSLNIAVSGMCLLGDSIFFYGGNASAQGQYSGTLGIIDLKSRRVVNDHLVTPPADNPFKTPYGIMVNPANRDIYVTDATNYVSSGKLYCFDRDGQFKWVTWTGDIPGHLALVPHDLKAPVFPERDPTATYSQYILAVDEYMPAPGQFVNTMPEYTDGDTPATMAAGDAGRLRRLHHLPLRPQHRQSSRPARHLHQGQHL